MTTKSLQNYIKENIDGDSTIMTDEFPSYRGLDKDFVNHYVVNHGKREYVRGEIHTNTAEGYLAY